MGKWWNPFSWGEEDPVDVAEKKEREARQAIYNIAPPPNSAVPGRQAWMPEAGLLGAQSNVFSYAPGQERAMLEARPDLVNEQVAMQDASQAGQAQSDALSRLQQYQALSNTADVYNDYRDIYKQGGLTAIDRANLEEAKNRNLATARGQREATLQNAEMRGLGGSGTELASLLAANEGAATRQSADSLGIAAQAQARRDAALSGAQGAASQQGALAGNIRGASFNEAFNRGSAADMVNQFNTAGLRDAEMRRAQTYRQAIANDTNAMNQAQQGNADWRRQWYNQDVAARNAMNQYYNVEEPWRVYEANAQKQRDLSNIYMGSPLTAATTQQAANSQQMMSNVAGAGAQLGAAAIAK